MSKPPKPVTLEEKGQMIKPYVPKKCPISLQLEQGKEYLYCTCGLSETQPFCDDSHLGTPFKPIPFIGKPQKISVLCGCKRNREEAGPYCDGSHSLADW